MNDRIRELAEQARPTYSNGKKVLGLNSEFHEVWMEKFAELLIAKCLSATDNVQEMFFNAGLVAKDPTETLRYREAEAACFMVKNKIKLMFGIEE